MAIKSFKPTTLDENQIVQVIDGVTFEIDDITNEGKIVVDNGSGGTVDYENRFTTIEGDITTIESNKSNKAISPTNGYIPTNDGSGNLVNSDDITVKQNLQYEINDIGDVETSAGTITMDGNNGQFQYIYIKNDSTDDTIEIVLDNLKVGNYILQVENDDLADKTITFSAGTGVDNVSLAYKVSNFIVNGDTTGASNVGMFNIIVSNRENGTTGVINAFVSIVNF